MILLIDMSYRRDSLSTMEFVYPLKNIAEEAGFSTKICHRNELSEEAIGNAERIILCGTALRDNFFIPDLGRFSWLREIQKPVLGICAGMQAIAVVFGGRIVQETGIGMHEVKVNIQDPIFGDIEDFTAYEMHSFTVEPPEDFSVIAGSGEHPVVIRHREKEIYGALFHPEVRNDWFIRNFLKYERIERPES